MAHIGLAYRPGLSQWIEERPAEVECVEVTAEEFYKGGRGKLRVLRERSPLLVRTRRLSLGTPARLDANELGWFASLVRDAQPPWISERLGFRCTAEVDLAFSVPVALTEETLDLFVDHARDAMVACGRPLLLENIASHLSLAGSLGEPEFLNRVCDRSGCGVLLDITALLVNSRNHGFDPGRWLQELDLRHVLQIHVGGCRERDRRWEDTHDAPLNEDICGLAGLVLQRAPVQAVILERDSKFPPIPELVTDLARLRALSRSAPAEAAGNFTH